jgi:hypothetical protein
MRLSKLPAKTREGEWRLIQREFSIDDCHWPGAFLPVGGKFLRTGEWDSERPERRKCRRPASDERPMGVCPTRTPASGPGIIVARQP